jgi:hypothetical protein
MMLCHNGKPGSTIIHQVVFNMKPQPDDPTKDINIIQLAIRSASFVAINPKISLAKGCLKRP